MKIKIRLADINTDALSIVDGARDFASRVAFRSLLPEDDQEFISAIGRIVTLECVEILVAEHESRVVGGIGISYIPFMWNPEKLVGEELFWWTSKNAPFRTGRMLIDEAMKRIDQKGAVPFFKSLETSPKGVARMYARMGLAPVETMFARI